MPLYTTQAGERLFGLASRFYPASTLSAGVASIVYANPNVFDGDGVLQGGLILDIPDPVLDIDFPEPTAEMSEYVSLIQQDDPPEHAPVGTTRNISAKTGELIEEPEAIRQDVVNRVLTYRGFREFRPRYGTRVRDGLTYNFSVQLLREAESVARVALGPAADRYAIDSIIARQDGLDLNLAVRVIPLYGLDPVNVVVPLLQVDLS